MSKSWSDIFDGHIAHMTILAKQPGKWWSVIRRSISGRAILIGWALILSSALGYGEVDVDDDFIEQAKIDTTKRLMTNEAMRQRKFLNDRTQLTHQEIESIVSAAISERAACEVDAMVKLASNRPELSLTVLLNWLVGREQGDSDHDTFGRVSKEEYENSKIHCDEEYFQALVISNWNAD